MFCQTNGSKKLAVLEFSWTIRLPFPLEKFKDLNLKLPMQLSSTPW